MEHDFVIITDADETFYQPWGEFGKRLAAAMVQPLRRRMDYNALSRKVFIVDQLPGGALPTYDREEDV